MVALANWHVLEPKMQLSLCYWYLYVCFDTQVGMVRNCNKHSAVAATHKFFKKAEYEMKGAAMSVDNGRYLICFPVTGTQHIITVGFWSFSNKCLMFELFFVVRISTNMGLCPLRYVCQKVKVSIWSKGWHPCGFSENVVMLSFAEILDRYSLLGRHFHGFSENDNMLTCCHLVWALMIHETCWCLG